MVQAKLIKKLVNDDSLVNDVDAKSVRGQVVAVEFEIVRIGDESRISFGNKIILQYSKFATRRHSFPVDDRNARLIFFTSPLAIRSLRSDNKSAWCG